MIDFSDSMVNALDDALLIERMNVSAGGGSRHAFNRDSG